jgi:hypothetical protein
MDIFKVLTNPRSKIFISILLGIGLAAVFKRTCGDGKKCMVIKGPKSADVSDHIYRINGGCYKYEPEVVKCAKVGV